MKLNVSFAMMNSVFLCFNIFEAWVAVCFHKTDMSVKPFAPINVLYFGFPTVHSIWKFVCFSCSWKLVDYFGCRIEFSSNVKNSGREAFRTCLWRFVEDLKHGGVVMESGDDTWGRDNVMAAIQVQQPHHAGTLSP